MAKLTKTDNRQPIGKIKPTGGFNHSPKHCYKGEHDINDIMEKMSINPHHQQQSNLYQ